MIFYSCIFSLDKTSNEYVYMFMILYSSLIKSKSLTYSDSYYILCDAESANVIKKIPMLSKVNLIILSKPTSLLEGMLWKYQLYKNLDIVNKDCFYIDVDMICIKETHFNLHPDAFYVFPEGVSSNSNYCGDMVLKRPHGYTAGFFGYNCGPTVVQAFESLLASADLTQPKKYYTLEQPYFNKAIEDKTIVIMPSYVLSFNGHTNKGTAHFINCCGDPGDGPLHFTKMLQYIVG